MRCTPICAAPTSPAPTSRMPICGWRTSTKPSSTMRSCARRRCPTAPSSRELNVGWAKRSVPTCGVNAWARREERAFAHHPTVSRLRRVQPIDLEAGRAFELALGQLDGQLRIDAALAGLAEQIGTNDEAAVGGRVGARAQLLDEERADGALALGRRQGFAVAFRFDPEAGRHDAAQSVGLFALLAVGLGDVVAVIGARIGHEADALEAAGIVEQGTGDHRKRHLMGAGPARDLPIIAVGAGDVFVFVVVFEINLVQAVRLCRTALEI